MPIPYVIVRRSASNRIHPLFSHIMSLRDVVIHIDDTSCTKWIFGWKQGLAEKEKQDSPN